MNHQEDAKYLKRKITSGTIDVHPTEKALVVRYEVEATILAETGDPVLGDRKQCETLVRVRSLDENTDVKAMARDVVDKCKLIHPSRLQEVEQLLYYLQRRRREAPKKEAREKPAVGEVPLEDPAFGGTDIKETADINDLEMYLEMLYDDLPEKLRGTALVLQLARNPENLDELCQNEILLGALARVLAEDWKKSVELATNIIYIFFCFSSFSQLHAVVAHFQVGSLCMKIVEHELGRKGEQVVPGAPKRDADNLNNPKRARKQAQQVQQATIKQEQLLRVAFYLLLNLAEDRKLEAKMHKKGIVPMLVDALGRRHNVELLILVLTFLKKLSIFVENKNSMAECGAVARLAEIITGFSDGSKDDVINVALRLLLNLSFDSVLRQHIVAMGLVPPLVGLLRRENNRLVSLCILYHVSLDQRNRHLFATDDCIRTLVKALLDPGRKHPEQEVVALCINLAADRDCAQMMIEGKNLQSLMARAFKTRNSLLAKILKNISRHEDDEQEGQEKEGRKKLVQIRRRFTDYVVEVAEQVKDAFRDAFAAECLGILANMTDPELDFEMVLKEYGLVDWLKDHLGPETIAKLDGPREELALEAVMLVGTACSDDASAALFADSGIIQSLILLLNARQEDDDMVLQVVYVFYQMVFHHSTRDVIIGHTQAPAYLIDLVHDKNEEIRKICSATLDIVAEHNQEWAERIQLENFRYHNLHWIEMVEMHHLHQGNGDEDDYLNEGLFLPGGMMAGDSLMDDHGFFGGFIEDASALEGGEFFYGDRIREGRDEFDPSLYASVSSMLSHGRGYPSNSYDFPLYERSPSVVFEGRDYSAGSGRGFGFPLGFGEEEQEDERLGGSSFYPGVGK